MLRKEATDLATALTAMPRNKLIEERIQNTPIIKHLQSHQRKSSGKIASRYRMLLHEKREDPQYNHLNVPTWIIGPALGEGPLIDRPADVLKVWPTREPIQRRYAEKILPSSAAEKMTASAS